MIRPVFDSMILLIVAGVLAVLAALASVIWARRRRSRVARLGGPSLVRRLAPAAVMSALGWRGALLTTAVLLAGIALAGPRWGQEQAAVQASGIDLVIAMDASLSMMAPDERPNRLERAKAEVRRLRSISPGDRVALLAFAGRSYILTPLTQDDAALDLYLDNLEPSVVGQAGSSLAATIRQGTELLIGTRTGADRALAIFTDAEIFEEEADVVAAAKYAKDNNVNVVLVGFGTTGGSTIPVVDERGRRSMKLDESGVVVRTRYHPEILELAAREAGGVAIDARESDKAGRVRAALAGLRRERRAVSSGDLLSHRFQLFLLPALLLLLIDTWLGERRGKRLSTAAAVTAAIALLMLIPSPARADDAADGVRALKAGRAAQAVALLKRAIDGGDKRPTTLYNYGTALLAADSLVLAAEVLERAGQGVEGELRYRAMFNLGLAHLKRGLTTQADSATQSLSAALEAYKRVLLMRPRDADAKWNFELALRKNRGGGGGGGGQQQSSGGGGQQPAPQPQQAGGVGQQQAEQILNSAARDERDVQGRRMKRNRPDVPPGGRDW